MPYLDSKNVCLARVSLAVRLSLHRRYVLYCVCPGEMCSCWHTSLCSKRVSTEMNRDTSRCTLRAEVVFVALTLHLVPTDHSLYTRLLPGLKFPQKLTINAASRKRPAKIPTTSEH